MIPFPGESMICGDAWSSDGYGFDLGHDVTFRGGMTISGELTPGHRSISSGTEWRGWCYNFDRPYLEAADDGTPLDVSWVIEVLAGAGTLVLSDYHDDGWGYSTSLSLPNALGALTISGPGTYLMPTTSFTNAVLRQAGYERGPAEVRIVCTSGSIDVQQVKLRMWPIGGPLGGWSAEPTSQEPYEIQPQKWSQAVGFPGGLPVGGTYASQADFRAALNTTVTNAAALFTGSAEWNSVRMLAWQFMSDPPEVIGDFGFTYYRSGPGEYLGPAGLVDGVDWIRPPEEVQYDDTVPGLFFQLTGPSSLTWSQGEVWCNLGPSVFSSPNNHFGDGSYHISIAEVDDFIPESTAAIGFLGTGTPIATVPPIGDMPDTSYPATFTLPDPVEPNQLYRLLFWHDGHVGDVDLTGGSHLDPFPGTFVGEDFLPLKLWWTVSPYYYWDPAGGARVPYLRQRNRDTSRAKNLSSRQRGIRQRGFL